MGRIEKKDVKAALLSGIIIFSGTVQFVTVTYLWKRNSIFSVVIGTVLYMILVQMVF